MDKKVSEVKIKIVYYLREKFLRKQGRISLKASLSYQGSKRITLSCEN